MEKALILAAGMGSRLAKAHDRPKPLVDINGQASIIRLLNQFEKYGIRETAITLGFRGNDVRSFIESNYNGSIKIFWYENHRYHEPNGVSVLSASEFVNERVMLSMADHVFSDTAVSVISSIESKGSTSYLMVDYDLKSIFDMDDATKVLTDPEGRIVDIGKEIPDFNCIDTGLFCISPELVEALARLASPTLSQGVRELTLSGQMLTVPIGNGWWQDVDTPETLTHALEIISKRGNE